MVPPGGRSELLGPLAHFGVQLRFGDRHAFGHDGRSWDHPVSTDVRIKQLNPRYLDGFEGGRKRVSDTFTHKNSGSCI